MTVADVQHMAAQSLAEISTRLPFLLRPENVARFEAGEVVIADRRVYPLQREFVRCRSVEEVARAIEEMVTQGSGPRLAASWALVLAAHELAERSVDDQRKGLQAARDRLVATRPTNTSVPRALDTQLAAAWTALEEGRSAEAALDAWVREFLETYYRRCVRLGELAADLLEDGDGVLSVCFLETSFNLAATLARESGKTIRVYASETRPYLQGSRLTAPSLHEMDIPVQIVTDNTPAYLMSQGKIQKYFSATDVVTMDGHVVNKIGTYQLAVVAQFHGIPYFPITHGPDTKREGPASVVIEERDPGEVRSWHGVPVTLAEIDAYYPAFDITPPHLIAGIVTEKGVLSPYDVRRHYGAKG